MSIRLVNIITPLRVRGGIQHAPTIPLQHGVGNLELRGRVVWVGMALSEDDLPTGRESHLMPIFRARYAGICHKCQGRIGPGDTVTWNRKQRGSIAHAVCSGGIPVSDSTPNTPEEVPETIPESKVNGEASATLDVLADALAKRLPALMDETLIREIVAQGIAGLESKLQAVIPLRIEMAQGDTVKNVQGQAHETLPRLLYLLSKRHHAYLYGPPGGGKSYAAKQCAETLEIPFGYISLNPQTPDSRLLGYLDATGNYRDTVFHQLYKGGGIFCIDELDNASPSLLTTLNSMLENGVGAFPCGMVDKHADFTVVATGNTVGKGANPQFPERRPFDAAFAERFSYIEWGYDKRLERAITLSINPDAENWLVWVNKVREWASQHAPRLVVSPRASFKGAEYLKDSKWSLDTIAETVLFKGMERDLKHNLLQANPFPSGRE